MKLRMGRLRIFALLGVMGFASSTYGVINFSDNFDSGASPQWTSNSGAWTATGGTYNATVPDNVPNANASLPYDLTDFTFGVTINNVQDSGIWLRSENAIGTIGRNGVLLVVGPGGRMYWHVVTGSSYGDSYASTGSIFTTGVSDPTLTIEVSGNDYAVYVGGDESPATSWSTTAFSSGEVALYSNSAATFDDVSLTGVPEPTTYAAMAGILMLGIAAYRRKR